MGRVYGSVVVLDVSRGRKAGILTDGAQQTRLLLGVLAALVQHAEYLDHGV